jgi:hypothetical protein
MGNDHTLIRRVLLVGHNHLSKNPDQTLRLRCQDAHSPDDNIFVRAVLIFCMRLRIGVGLTTAAYVLLLYTALAAPAYAHSHSHLDPAMLAAYAASWPVAMTSVFALTGVTLAMIPVRRGEKWAIWMSVSTFLILLIVRTTTDERCLVVLDPHQHGCHTFMLLVIVGITGLILSAFGVQR